MEPIHKNVPSGSAQLVMVSQSSELVFLLQSRANMANYKRYDVRKLKHGSKNGINE